MNESEFRQHWLNDGESFETFEAENLKYSVWGYYKAVLSTDNCIQAFERLSRRSILGIGRAKYEEDKQFLERVQGMLCNPDIRFRAVAELLERNGEDCARYQRLIRDDDGQMVAGMLCCDEYSQAKSLEPDELLDRFTAEDYLRETRQMNLMPQYERIMLASRSTSRL